MTGPTNILRLILSAATLCVFSDAEAKPKADPTQQRQQQSVHVSVHSRARLGAQVITMSEDLRGFFGAPKDAGVLVDKVLPNTPAAKAGLRTGDVIIAVQGQATSEAWDIIRATASADNGQKISLAVIRNKKRQTLSATLDSVPGTHLGAFREINSEFNFNFPFASQQFDFDGDFPFASRDEDASSRDKALRETIRRLEERLDKLEGKGRASKAKK